MSKRFCPDKLGGLLVFLVLGFGIVLSAFAPLLLRAQSRETTRYTNPILWADYSDPDIIRDGDSYLLVASTFAFMPGIPVLRSPDLVHWTIIGHVFPRLDVDPRYSMQGGNRYGGGAWAPSIRMHAGRYYVYFPTPDEGIFVSTASDPSGPWTPPVAVLSGKGLEDPCPFWDSDGQAYLIHSRLGAGPLILHKMSPDGLKVLDEGVTVVEDSKRLPVLEGPKFYKRNGYYYIFAPYGGVNEGAQAVLRARNIYGPYEFRTVLEQGSTQVNGPHQGGYVETPTGEGWFLHFHSAGAYGRIDYLEPVRWQDDWPVIGDAAQGGITGTPVASYAMPGSGKRSSSLQSAKPATSDEFSAPMLGPQWEWNHNPWPAHWSLLERRGYLRLHAMPAEKLLDAKNTLTELGQDSDYSFTVRIEIGGMEDGQRAGVAMFEEHPGAIGVIQRNGVRVLQADLEGGVVEGPKVNGPSVQLRIEIAKEKAQYSWSQDEGKTFHLLGAATPIHFSWWKAARPSLFCYNSNLDARKMGFVDIDWVRYTSRENMTNKTMRGKGSSQAYGSSSSSK